MLDFRRQPLRRAFAARVLALAAGVFIFPHTVLGERARSPGDATVFIRLVGSVHAELEGNSQSADWDQVEIGSGSGFVISPYGYVLTNQHVIGTEEFFISVNGRRAKVTLRVSKVQVCFPPDSAIVRAVASQCFEASVYAADPAIDLAVLFISAPELPYLALGDSDVVNPGLPVDALGYPFGRQLKLGQATASDLVPEVSTTAGTISALRAGDGGERRFLQIGANVNPGNSGGPVVDREGYAVGVIRMKLAGDAGIGFAIPVNQVKDFLESRGLDHLMPAHRLLPGPLQSVEGKGLRLRIPQGLADVSPFRTRVDTETKSGDMVLRIDRIFSPMSPKQIEQTLVGTQTFERVSTATSESQFSSQPEAGRLLLGHSTGSSSGDNRDIRMDYAILDLGAEKLVARYIGPAEQMAFNESTMRGSLAALAGERLVAAELEAVDKLVWSTVPPTPVPAPAGWIVEPGGAPSRCAGLPQWSATLAMSSARDFTVGLRAAVWSSGDFGLDEAASGCSSRRGSLEGSSYVARAEWLGVSYSIEGIFTRVASRQVLQLEVVSPAQKSAFAQTLLAAWMKKTSEAQSR